MERPFFIESILMPLDAEAQRRDVILPNEVVGHQSTPKPLGYLFDQRFWSGRGAVPTCGAAPWRQRSSGVK